MNTGSRPFFRSARQNVFTLRVSLTSNWPVVTGTVFEIDPAAGHAIPHPLLASLHGGGIAATVMSNLGLERFLGGQGITLHRTAVGDRYVMEAYKAVSRLR